MNTHADKTQKTKSQSASGGDSQMQSSNQSTFQFVDNRPESVSQHELQKTANNSTQVQQLRAFQEMANGSPQEGQVTQLATIKDAQTSEDMMQPNESLGVDSHELLEETQEISPKDLVNQVNQLMRNAETAKDDFKNLINRILDKSGDKAQNGDPGFGHITKATQGAIDKAKGRMEGKTTAALNDVLRGSIICDDMETLNRVQKNLDDESLILFEQIGEKTQKKNAFEKSDRKSAGDMVGYGDIKYIMPVIHYESPGEPDFWMYSEIQVMSNAMKGKKSEGGHSFYDITREAKLDESSGAAVYKITSTESSKKGASQLLGEHLKILEKGVNTDTLTTLIPQLENLVSGQAIELSNKEYNELGFAGELIYVKERLEGNLIAQGVLKS
tara:strand:- start:126 stop:1283 length:1158 start_codon:yes stop_codon:yes gene_type:complete